MEADFLSRDRLLPEWHLLPQVAQAAFCLWGLPEVDLLASSRSAQCHYYFTLDTPLPLGVLGLNAFSHPWNFQVSYVLDGGSLASHSSQHAGRHSSAVSHCKRSLVDVSVGQALKGLRYLHLTLWLLSDVCYADKGSLPQSVRWWWGQLECLHHGSTSSARGSGLVGVLDRVYQTMPSLPLN